MERVVALLLFGVFGCSSSKPIPALGEAPFELAAPCVVALDAEVRPVARVGMGVSEPREVQPVRDVEALNECCGARTWLVDERGRRRAEVDRVL